MEKPWFIKYPPGVKQVINPEQYTSITQMLQQAAIRHSDATALVNFGSKLTYQELSQLSTKFASYLHQQGWRKGDHLAIMLPNCLQYPVILWAAWQLGLVVTNINPLYTHREVSAQCRDAKVKGIVALNFYKHLLCQSDYPFEQVILTGIGDLFSPIKRLVSKLLVRVIALRRGLTRRRLSHVARFRHALKIADPSTLPHIMVNPSDTALLQYTGGTSGKRKAAVLSHHNLIANILQVRTWLLPISRGKQITTIVALPLYHIFSLTTNLLSTLDIGARNILISNPRKMGHFIKTLRHYRFNILLGVDTLFNQLLRHKHFHKIDFSAMTLSLAGGMALKKSTATQWHKQTGHPLLQGYGLTEASPVISIAPLDETSFNGSVGLPVPSTDIRICDENGQNVDCHEIGELWVKGPQVMQGYWQNPEETARVLTEDGWLKTADMAYLDEAGYLYLVDRKDDLMIVSGFNVYPNEVENVIAKHPGVAEVSVVGIKTQAGNTQIKAFIVKNTDHLDLTEKAIRDFCRDWLTAYKIPKLIEFREVLPKSTVGKILRRQLNKPAPNSDDTA